MNPIKHLEISASAGSGKTYQLANRIIQLLASGIPAKSINCMTFTRKASAEFLDRVLLKLATATEVKSAKKQLQQELGFPQCEPLDLLKDLLQNINKLHMGTLDSFFYKILQQSALDIGFTSKPEILEDHAWQEFQIETLGQIVRKSSPEVRSQFFEAFKQANWGSQNKGIEQKLVFFIQKNIDIYRKIPQLQYWANPNSIGWKNKDETQTRNSFYHALNILQTIQPQSFLEEKQSEKWLIWCRELTKGIPTQTSSNKILTEFLKKIFTNYSDLKQGKATFAIAGKRATLPVECCQALAKLTSAIFDYNLILKRNHTLGIYKIIRAFDKLYKKNVFQKSKLYYPDIPAFLQNSFANQPSNLEELYYRIDQKFDHWLIDEFQDTSMIQWKILQPIIDEVIQDDNQQRSFFYVGDRKQSVYAWRGGEPKLFGKIRKHYGRKIDQSFLYRSYRSSPVVLEFINQVFGNPSVIKDLFPKEAADLWNQEWKNHLSSNKKDYGEVALLWVNKDSIWKTLSEKLCLLEPLANSLSCAILVETNQQVKEAKQFLQKQLNYPITSEEKICPFRDSIWTRSFFALWRTLEYPHNYYERRIVEMSPIFSSIVNLDTDWSKLHEELQTNHQQGRLSNWISKLWDKTQAHDHLQPIDHRCYQKLRIQAETLSDSFETLTEKRRKLESIQIETQQSKESIQIMTIHKAKGLGFDIVFLPFGAGTAQNSFTKGREGIVYQEDPQPWVWDLPPVLYQQFTPELQKYQKASHSKACYESFCKWYVAMTRAKTHLYLIGSPPSPNSTALNLNRWLHQIFPPEKPLYREGKNGLYPPKLKPSIQPEKSPNWAGFKLENPKIIQSTTKRSTASQSIQKRNNYHEEIEGTQFHEILQQLDHYQSINQLKIDLSKIIKTKKIEETFASKIDQWIQKPTNQIPFLEISPEIIIWKEKAFDIFFQEQWISGIFDRVHWNPIKQDALVYEFKRTRPHGIRLEKVQIQLEIYKQALNQLTSIPIEKINTQVLYLQK